MSGLEQLCLLPLEDWKLLVLAGLPARHPILPILVTRLEDKVRLGLGESSTRLVANLEGGMADYLSRRTKSFRRSIRRSQDKAETAGIRIEDASKGRAGELFERIVAIEKRAWKGRDAVGIQSGDMHDFYKLDVAQARSARCPASAICHARRHRPGLHHGWLARGHLPWLAV